MLLVIWWYAAQGQRLIDTSINRSQIVTVTLRAFLTPMIFLVSIAVIIFRYDYTIYVWLLVIVVEGVDLVSTRIRRRSHQEFGPIGG